jgi:hypothetical protein
MITELTDEAIEYGLTARKVLEAAGGDQLAQVAEAEPEKRGELVTTALADVGAWDLNPRAGVDEAEAAASLCRSAGYFAVPYPVAERLSRPRDVEADGLLVVDPEAPAAAVASLSLRWVAVDLDGSRSVASPRAGTVRPRHDAFVCPLELEPLDEGGAADVSLALVLPCWTLLGMLDRALELTRGYVLERQQFGQPLATFQGVQFQLTDGEVERVGLEELAKYALWSFESGDPAALHDALAVRAAALQAAEVVFRVAHQLHGAIGFCDETTLSWISRASVPLRRLPFGTSATRAELTRRMGRRALTGLFTATPPEPRAR